MKTDVVRIAARFDEFAAEARGSSTLYSRLSLAIAADPELLSLLLRAPELQQRANLLFAAVHELLLRGIDHPLAAYYASISSSALDPDDSTFAIFRDFCLSYRDTLEETIAKRQTQTNEVQRSVAFLPVFQYLSRKKAIAIVEVGTSAGLNLLVDRYQYKYGDLDWSGPADSAVRIHCQVYGRVPPLQDDVRIAYRIGIDTHPLDVTDSDDERWLMACVWPEQIERQSRLRAALAIAHENPPGIARGDVLEILGDILADIPREMPICVFNSATLFYFSAEECERFIALLDEFGSERLHWVSLEGGAFQTFGAKLPFDGLYDRRPSDRPTDIFGLLGYASWPDGKRQDKLLGRVDMHGRWIEWGAHSFE